jgi:hypothetical protein
MDTPMQTAPVQVTSSGMQKRRMLLTIIIIVAVIAVGWLVYKKFFYVMTPEEYKESVIKSVADSSPLVAEELKTPVIEQVAKDSAPAKGKAAISEKQKVEIIQSLNQ